MLSNLRAIQCTHYDTLLRISLFFCVLCLSACSTNPALNTPRAKQGILDLSQWNFTKNGPVKLDGEWEFYWNKLVPPEAFTRNQACTMTGYIPVRSSWTEATVNGQKFPSMGMATYRLRVKCPGKIDQLALKLLDMGTAYKLWVNGKAVSQNGIVSSNLDSVVPNTSPAVKVLNGPFDTMDIVVQVANNFHAKAGIWESILLGESNQIITMWENEVIKTIYVAGAATILAVVFFLIYSLRRKEHEALILCMICLIFFTRIMITGERLLYHWFSGMSVNTGYRIEYFTLIFVTLAISLYIWYLFPTVTSKYYMRFVWLASIVFSAMVLFAKTSFYTHQLGIIQLYIVLCALHSVIVVFESARRRQPLAYLFLFSFIVLFVAVANDILYSQFVINTGYYVSIAFSFFLLVQAYMMSQRSAGAFKKVENLSFSLNKANVHLAEMNEGLEAKVSERTRQLEKQMQKSDELLLNILPEQTAKELKRDGYSKARTYNDVSVMFADFKNFTKLSEDLSSEELVAELDTCFSAFDNIMTNHHVEKIKTIGDAYLAVSGLPLASTHHAIHMVEAALEIRDYMIQRRVQLGEKTFEVRIGIHSGSVVAGIVGQKKFAFDIWGDTVNTAARMEQHGEAGQINISGSTYALVGDFFDCESRGQIEAKNKGMMDMYFLLKKKSV